MSALPHLLHRARRWFDAQMMRSRAAQLSALIIQIEQQLADDYAELSSLRAERSRILACLRMIDARTGGHRDPA